MVKQRTAINEHDVVSELLPWHANGTLAGDQSKLVQTHLRQCTECQQELTLLNLSYSAANTGATSYPNVDYSLAKVMKRIEDSEPSQYASDARPGSSFAAFIGRVNQLLPRPTYTWAATAAAGILVAVLGFQLWTTPQLPEYQTLSSPGLDTSPLQLSLQFVDDVDTADVQRLLEAASIDFKLHRKTDQHYIVELVEPQKTTGMNTLLEILSGNERIARVDVVSN